MSDTASNDQSANRELPERRVTANMLVAYNMAYFRKAAGLTQEQFGERLGWTNVAVSAAERSWDGKRVRKFDADEIVSIARALEIPVAALLLPPSPEGPEHDYVLRVGPGDQLTMTDYFAFSLYETPPPLSQVMRAYEQRWVLAIKAYFGEDAGEQVQGRLADFTSEVLLTEFLRHARASREKLAEFAEALPGVIKDNEVMQDLLKATVNAMREQRGWRQETPEEREEGAREGQRLSAVLLP